MDGEQSSSRNGQHTLPEGESRKRKSTSELMASVFFMSDERWNNCRDLGIFDYVVVGSSFCAWAFTQRMLEKNPGAKILILERGEYYYLEHFENLLPSSKRRLTYDSKTWPWSTTEGMHNEEYIDNQDGLNEFFGGQSSFWRGWCPQPTSEDLDGWPESVKDIIQIYFPEAIKLLNVKPANEVCSAARDNLYVFGKLQDFLKEKISKSSLPEAIKRVDHASLAVREDKLRSGRIQKTSVADPLLNLLQVKKSGTSKGEQQPLEIKIDCVVEKIVHENGKAVALETSKGNVKLGNAKLILAMGVLPSTTLMLNSFPPSSFQQLAGIGTRYTAHFRSSVLARLPRSAFSDLETETSGKVEVAAMHIPGVCPNSKHQFHIQVSAFLDETPGNDIHNTLSQFPDVLPALLMEQLLTSKDPPHIIFLCKTIGGLDHNNRNNRFHFDSEDSGSDEISNNNTNPTLQVILNETDLQLWDTMDKSTLDFLKRFACDKPDDRSQLEFWHPNNSLQEGCWQTGPPLVSQIRRPILVHPASTMWIGDEESSPVDLDYRFRGVKNVYLTGGALWPTAGSWNPTCTMTALAIHLADNLANPDNSPLEN